MTRILLADHDRLIVTHVPHDNTVIVLRPEHATASAILDLARLVLPGDTYDDLVAHLTPRPRKHS